MKKLFAFLSVLFCFLQAVGQGRTISGTITEKVDGASLPGVNVVVKGVDNLGTVSDFDGRYEVVVPDSCNVLVFSFLGMITQEVQIDGRSVIDIALEQDDSRIEEVVIIGYGTQKVSGSLNGVTLGQKVKSKTLKTWKRSNKTENAVRLSVGDEEEDTLALVMSEMKVRVDGFRARVTTDYFFYSDYSESEGTFKIRLPAGASPYYFAFGSTEYLNKEKDREYSFEDYYDMDIEDYIEGDSLAMIGNEILTTKSDNWKQPRKAEVVPVETAAFAYTETVHANVDPLLAEWGGADIFNCRVFPIESGQLHRVVIGYDVDLTNVGSDKVFNLNIPQNSGTTVVDLDIAELKGVDASISYKEGIRKENERLLLHLENPKEKNIEIRYAQAGNGLLLGEDYFAASLTLDLPQVEKGSTNKDAIIALDVSASSNPDKFNVWLKLLEATLLNNRESIQRFNVMFFNIETAWYKDGYVENTPRNVEALLAYCNQLSLEGATDIGAAMQECCNPDWLKKGAQKNVFLMSDGSVTWGKEELYSISAAIAKENTVYVYNTGISGTDTNMLEHLARESGGNLFSVTGEDEIEAASKAFNFESWRILDVKLSGCKDIVIKGRPKCLFPGQKIVVGGLGKPRENDPVKISLTNGKGKRKVRLSFANVLPSDLAKRVYGQIAVEHLESFDFLAKKQAEAYAIHYKVPAKTCSMLMLESDQDYERFKIVLDKGAELVRKTSVNVLVEDLLEQMKKSEGFEKDKFIRHLENLEKNEIIHFVFSDTLKKMIKRIPAKAFRIDPSKFTAKNRLKKHITDSALVELAKDTPKNKCIEEEADSLMSKFGKYDALKMMSTIIERNPNNAVLIQDLAFSALKYGLSEHAFYLFKKVIEKSPHKPHAYRFIAQLLADMKMYDLAMVYYEIAFSGKWEEKYEDFKDIVGVGYFGFLQKLRKSKQKFRLKKFALKREKSLRAYFESDLPYLDCNLDEINLMISMNWNTDDSDIDLHVIEPSGEDCYYGNKSSKSGGRISGDVRDGYGPEMYTNKALVEGMYKVRCKYYSSPTTRLSTHSKVYVVIYKNWGSKKEVITRKVVSLKATEEEQSVMEVVIN